MRLRSLGAVGGGVGGGDGEALLTVKRWHHARDRRQKWLLVVTRGGLVHGQSLVDADVRYPVLVPLLLCPPKGSLWGAVKA